MLRDTIIMSAYRNVLVAVDGSKAANRGLRQAVRLAKRERAHVAILHVVSEFYAFATPGAGAAEG